MSPHINCKVAAFNLTTLDTYKYPAEVEWEIDQNNKSSYIRLAKIINKDNHVSGVILQHEYGIFGGKEGKNILSFMQNCKKPTLVTLHTVLPTPTLEMEEVTARIIDLATTLVVLTISSKNLVEKIYPKAVGKVFVIPHGIHPIDFSTSPESKIKLELNKYTILSTFGLLSRGKGIEYVIKALPKAIKKYPSILYLILGKTHPVIVRNEGEKYRIKLLRLIRKLGLETHVRFYDQYLDLHELFEFLKATDIYISTSTNPNQAVSGTLSYALGSGRAVISTQFAQAKEIVTPDTGRLVPIKNPEAITKALLDLLSKPERLKEMHLRAYETTRSMLWSNVAEKYVNLLNRPIIPPLNLNHLQTMTNQFGLFQFASLTTPNKDFGYTLDDNARAAIVCSWLAKTSYTKEVEALFSIYFKFIQTCQNQQGQFINYISYHDQKPTAQNGKEDIEETQARTLWALSEIMNSKNIALTMRKEAEKIFLLKFNNMPKLTHIRAKAVAIKSFALAANVLPDYRKLLTQQIKEYADSLLEALKSNSVKYWHWFENHLSYNNGILPESMFIAGQFTGDSTYKDGGISSLQFLIKKTFSGELYMPIGQSSWYKNHGKRSEYDQQPEDPTSMILALSTAYKNTQNVLYKILAERCFSWFLGKNSLHVSLYDEKTGGCYDGLRTKGVNLNEGGESLISYLMSHIIMKELI